VPCHERLTQADPEHLGVLVRDRLGFLLAEASVDQIAGDACETVTTAGGSSLRRRLLPAVSRLGRTHRAATLTAALWGAAHRRRTGPALMEDLFGPGRTVPPAKFEAAVGVGLPAARSSHFCSLD
jgi:hypothetical protein